MARAHGEFADNKEIACNLAASRSYSTRARMGELAPTEVLNLSEPRLAGTDRHVRTIRETAGRTRRSVSRRLRLGEPLTQINKQTLFLSLASDVRLLCR